MAGKLRRLQCSRHTKSGPGGGEAVSCLMELERAAIWMSRVAYASRGTVVYRISLVQEVDVVSSKVRCHGSCHEWTGGSWILTRHLVSWADDIVFLLSVGRTSETLCANRGASFDFFTGFFYDWRARCDAAVQFAFPKKTNSFTSEIPPRLLLKFFILPSPERVYWTTATPSASSLSWIFNYLTFL